MFTPREIRDTEFERVSRGYNIEDVDGFLSRLADQIEQLAAEKAEADKKLMVLAEKIEEYRRDEDALKSAMISAERMKDNLLAETQQQKDMVIRDAQQKADRIVEEAEKRIEREEITLKALKQQVAAFKSEILNIYKAHLEIISDLPDEPVDADYDESAIAELFTHNSDTAPALAMDPTPQTSFAAEIPQFAAESAPAPVPASQPENMPPAAAPEGQPDPEVSFAAFDAQPETPKTEESRFDKLDFGENFSFGRD